MNTPFGDVEAERCVLGAILQDPSVAAWALAEIAPDAFTRPEYRRAWDAAGALYRAGKAADMMTVSAAVREKSGVDIAPILIEAVRATPSAANARTYAGMVCEYAHRRALRDACNAAINSLGECDADEAGDRLMAAIRANLGGRDAWVPMAQVGASTFDMLEGIARGENRSIPTGMPDLDAALAGGLRKGEVTVLAAGTGQGKSAFAMHIAQNAAKKGFRVGFVSREMSAEQYGIRALTSLTGIGSGDLLRAGKLSGDQWTAIGDAVERMGKLPISFSFRAATVEDVRRETQRRDIDLLVVDYIQIMGTREKCASEHLRVSSISRQLKEIALDMGIPVLVLSQLKRLPGVIKRRPVLADLKESGSIENDADVVLFLYQPSGPGDDSIPETYAGWVEAAEDMGDRFLLLEIAKQRMFATSTLGVCFDTKGMRFYTPQREG